MSMLELTLIHFVKLAPGRYQPLAIDLLSEQPKDLNIIVRDPNGTCSH